MIVSIVGADGAGKSTLVKLLNDTCVREQIELYQVARWDILERKKVASARFIERDLQQLRTCVAEMPLCARFRFLTWAMSISLHEAQQRHDESAILLFDSYWHKHAAVELVYGSPVDEILPLVKAMPKSDFVFYLKIAPRNTLQRIRKNLVPYECGMDVSCSDESFLAHQSKVVGYLDKWSSEGDWHELDATDSPAELVSQILTKLQISNYY